MTDMPHILQSQTKTENSQVNVFHFWPGASAYVNEYLHVGLHELKYQGGTQVKISGGEKINELI